MEAIGSIMGFKTDSIQEGVYQDETFGSITTPVYFSSTFEFPGIGEYPKFDYSRSGNPTRHALEENLKVLEGGVGASILATGMAAVTVAMMLFKPGDHIITGKDIYGGTHRSFLSVFAPRGIEFSFVNMQDLKEIESAVKSNTKGIWIETPNNPLMRITDIEGVVKIAKKHGLKTIADNTFMSPYFQKPLALGVDISLESTTKYINGHSDVVGGALISKSEEDAEEIKFLTNALGVPCSPFDAWLVLRGVKTLAYRMEGHQKNAMQVAEYLEKHPTVKNVYYPGLKTHPGHDIAKRQMSGFGGMLSLEIDRTKISPNEFVKRLKLFHFAESLGGVESLFCQPWSMTHLSIPEEARIEAGLNEGIFRFSIGLEDVEDLIADLDQALNV